MKWTTLFAVSSLAAFSASVLADETVTLHKIDEKGLGEVIGTIKLADTPTGLMLAPNLKGLPPGQHGFHVHENGACGAKEKDHQGDGEKHDDSYGDFHGSNLYLSKPEFE